MPNAEPKSTSLATGEEVGALNAIYQDLRQELKEKDTMIQELSHKLGRAEEIAKNSVSLIEFKKSQFLLEESKTYLNKEVNNLQKTKNTLQEELRYEKTSNKILIVFVVVLLVLSASIWFIKI
ncbi:MAG: hypothetical protein H6767_05990 [Candidatus Peribacteria bacterium]|nr:MAG: hypothetical protein H6767_05990 [Candidatus Peribacteria bacterium]